MRLTTNSSGQGALKAFCNRPYMNVTSIRKTSCLKSRGLKAPKQSVTSLGKDFQRLKNGLIKCRDYIFNFLEDPLIPSDNNDSERGIRKLKIKLKNSGTFRSELGADAFLELHSIVETAKKHDLSPYKAIRALWRCTDSYGIR